MLYTTHYGSPLGGILLAAKGGALTGLWFDGQKYFLGTQKEPVERRDEEPVLLAAKTWLDRYLAGERPAIQELPLAPAGGEFRKAVWDELCQIPYGAFTTYGELAQKVAGRLGRAHMAAQAVGGAVGHNPISIIIPCHRVVGANGSLTGYAGGIDRKIRLLTLEGAPVERLFVPKNSTAP